MGDFAILIVDNASTDNTQEISSSFQKRDRRVRYVRNETNLGMIRNWRRAAELATTPYVKYVMDDDALEPECMAAFDRTARENPTCAVFSCLFHAVLPDGSFWKSFADSYVPDRLIPGDRMLDFLVQWPHQIGCPTQVMARTEALRDTAGVWSNLPTTQGWGIDSAIWACLLKRGDFYCINRPLVRIRAHPGAATTLYELGDKRREDEHVASFIAELAGGQPDHWRWTETHVARTALLSGAHALTRRDFRAALRDLRHWALSRTRWRAAYVVMRQSMARSNLVRTERVRYRDHAMRAYWAKHGLLHRLDSAPVVISRPA
jgi:glycosyltransferase involved in cell wall biosynthesis